MSPSPSNLPTPSMNLQKHAGFKNNNNIDVILKNVREGKLNKLKNITSKQLKEIFNRKNVRITDKYNIVNKAFENLGGREVYNTLGNNLNTNKLMPFIKTTKGGYPNKFFTNYAPKIDYKLMTIKNNKGNEGFLVLGKGIVPLGNGAAGMVVKCISKKKCDRVYKDAVLKISANNAEYRNEVNAYETLNAYKGARPIAPKMLAHFVIDDAGFILIQNAQTLYPDRKVIQWENMNQNKKGDILPALEKAMNTLHYKLGIGHGNMHSLNIWVAIRKGENVMNKYLVFFTDFGRAYNTTRSNYNYAYTKNNKKKLHRYNGMAHRTPLRNLNSYQVFMNDDEVLQMYEEFYSWS